MLRFITHLSLLIFTFASNSGWLSPGNLLDISWIFIFILYAEMFDRFLDSKNFFDNGINIFQMIFEVSRLVSHTE